jgi:hypothetical protein
MGNFSRSDANFGWGVLDPPEECAAMSQRAARPEAYQILKKTKQLEILSNFTQCNEIIYEA